MPTRPPSPDPSGTAGDSNPFAGIGAAGLGFFQDWMKAASSALPHLGGSTAGAAWTLPTLDPDELDKRIQDLKTVQFWLEQNARMIGMTIQTLEVQRMTLQTLHGMQVPLDALRESLQAQASAAPSSKAPSPPPAPESSAGPSSADEDASTAHQAAMEAAAAATPPPGVNPMQWWSTLTEQFSNLASQAVQAGQDAISAHAAGPSTEPPPRRHQAPSASAKAGTRANPTGRARAGKSGPAPSASRKAPKA